MVKIAPSILTANFAKLGDEIKTLENIGSDMLHLDVMDGVFVPNISFGLRVVECIRKATALPLDVHLMITRPQDYIERFAKAGADIVGIHLESDCNAEECLKAIRSAGCKSCLTIKPATPAADIFNLLSLCDMVLVMTVEPGFGGQSFMYDCISKVTEIKNEAARQGLSLDLEVDGGIDNTTAKVAVEAGANVLVCGSYLVGPSDCMERMKTLRASYNLS